MVSPFLLQRYRLLTVVIFSSSSQRMTSSLPSVSISAALNRSHKVEPRTFLPRKTTSTVSFSSTSNTETVDDLGGGNDVLIPTSSSSSLDLFHVKGTVESTQKECKRLLSLHRGPQHDDDNKKPLGVLADMQSKGRGTNNRTWVALEGNLFLTCAIPSDVIPPSKVTLLPLGIGVLISQLISRYVTTTRNSIQPSLKWPNDVLLGDQKVAGTLIENVILPENKNDDSCKRQHWWLIGVGINVASVPESLQSDEKDALPQPRKATSLALHHNDETEPLPTALDLGIQLAQSIEEWTYAMDTSLDTHEFLQTWKSWSTIRNGPTTYWIRETGEEVQAIDITESGQLVVLGVDGIKKTLNTEYLH